MFKLSCTEAASSCSSTEPRFPEQHVRRHVKCVGVSEFFGVPGNSECGRASPNGYFASASASENTSHGNSSHGERYIICQHSSSLSPFTYGPANNPQLARPRKLEWKWLRQRRERQLPNKRHERIRRFSSAETGGDPRKAAERARQRSLRRDRHTSQGGPDRAQAASARAKPPANAARHACA